VSLRRLGWLVPAVAVVLLASCATHPPTATSAVGADAGTPSPVLSLDATPSAIASPSSSPSPSVSPSSARPSRKPAPKPSGTLKKAVPAGADMPAHGIPSTSADGVPARGKGTFSVAPGGTPVVGNGSTLVSYRVEVEDGIPWGSNPVWTPASFASAVDTILANPRGWTAAAAQPITDADQHMTNASWRFQRVDGDQFSVKIRLATPDTTDRLCGSVGMTTMGQYSCRFGNTEVINLRRWLHGVPGFGTDLPGYRNMVVNHEMGHFLGFDHMRCPGPGQPAPVMQQQTISLDGCLPNPYPFAADGTFVTGAWASS